VVGHGQEPLKLVDPIGTNRGENSGFTDLAHGVISSATELVFAAQGETMPKIRKTSAHFHL
jgi:hypothetical protein